MNGYKEVAVISGKGGTGKTTVVAALAAIAEDKVIADADVDAANLYIIMKPHVNETQEFWGAKIAVRDQDKCKQCGECENACRFDAITVDDINIYACEGCGFCTLVCPESALELQSALSGDLYISDTKYGPMAHAKLAPGAESSGRLVTKVRQAAESLAIDNDLNRILIDGPPGIGCTATAAIADTDLALIVTEPTPSGIHDMIRAMHTATHFGVPSLIIVNRADINPGKCKEIEQMAAKYDVRVLAELPFDPEVTWALAAATPIVEYDGDRPISQKLYECWERIDTMLG